MILPYSMVLLLWLAVAASTAALPELRRRDADVESLFALGITRQHGWKDHSGKKGDPKDKYFHESTVRWLRAILLCLCGKTGGTLMLI